MKRQNILKNILSLLLMLTLIAGTAFSLISCGSKINDDNSSSTSSEIVKQELGQGSIKFNFIVADKDKNETLFLISTDEETLADALTKLNLIEGEEGPYGLYVKKVNGILADYNVDGTYWSLIVDSEYSNLGADSVKVQNGKTYKFVVSK